MTYLVRLFTPNDVLGVAEIDGVRERSASEPMHYRLERNEPCHLCNAENGPNGPIIWIDSLDKWKAHPNRCNAVAFICSV